MSKIRDLSGQKFGRLEVLAYAGTRCLPSGGKKAQWLCRCDCGNEVTVLSTNLIRGISKSCGCLNDELRRSRSLTHGGRHTRLYSIWSNMITRCEDSNNANYSEYGARGITIDPNWRRDFADFREWAIANGYQPGLTIDRIDNSAGYTPCNCRWADARTQANNRRNTIFVEYNGELITLAGCARRSGIKYHTLYARYKNNNTLL